MENGGRQGEAPDCPDMHESRSTADRPCCIRFSDSFQRVTMHRGRHPGDTREEAGGRYLPHGRRPRTAGQPASARQGSLLLSTFNESRAELVSDVHLFLPPLRFLNLGGFEARVIVSFPPLEASWRRHSCRRTEPIAWTGSARTFNWQKR